MGSKKRLQLKKLLKKLKGYRARHTELISVYIPSGYSLNSVIQQLAQEQGTAENIKSKSTRKNVQTALEQMIRQLKTYGKTPPNGLAIFSGNVSGREGQQEFEVFAIEPAEPLNTKIYKCDQKFHLAPLKHLLAPKKTYGLVVIDRQEANIGLLKGSHIEPVYNKDSLVPGKTKKGGQSAARFARVREGMAKDFFKKIAKKATNIFKREEKLHGILVGGPGPTKENFVSDYLPEKIREQVIAVKDIGYTSMQGMEELVNKSQDVLAKEEIIEEQQAVDKFLRTLNKKSRFATYGKDMIEKAAKMNAIKLLLISETIDESYAEKLGEQVESTGGKWKIISEDSREGKQLAALGGLGAILRFPIK